MSILDFPSTAVNPFYSSTASMEFRTREANFGDGYTQRSGDGLNTEIETIPLIWNTLTESEYNTIIDFLKEREGYKAFNFTAPGQSSSKKWICKKYNGYPRAYTVYYLEATFTRVYDL